MGFKDWYENRNKTTITKKDETSNKTTSSSGFKDWYTDRQNKFDLQKTINFDTLQSDLTNLSQTIGNVYNGWQTKETMQNTLSSVQSMYDRLGKYQEYQKKYGGTDLSELQGNFKSLIDEWDDLSKQYGRYKSADDYTTAIKNTKLKLAEEEKMKTDDLGVVQTEIKDLESMLKTAKGHRDKINGLEVKKNTWEHRTSGLTTDGDYSSKVKAAENELNEYLKSIGYKNETELEKALNKKKNYLNRAEWLQKGISMSSVGDESSENYDKDFAKKSAYIVPEEKGFGFSMVDDDEERYKYINDESYRTDYGINVNSNAEAGLTTVGYEYMTDKEKQLYNYYYNSDKDKAKEYLNTITESLGTRKAMAEFERYEGKWAKELLYGVNAGFDQFASGMKNLFNTKDEYIPVNATQQMSGMIRDDLNYKHGILGQGAYDLITTTSNMLPSVLTSAAIGTVNPALGANVGAGLMGASAAGNAYQEMLNLGYDRGQAMVYSGLVGASEAYLQKLMGGISALGGASGKISKIVSGIDNGFARFAIKFGGSALAEGFEEAAQEVLNPLFQNITTDYDMEADVDWSEVVYSGLLGALSGGVMEGPGIVANSIGEVKTGKTIKANERISDMFDIANNPEIASAYETYTRYANKGINAENISNAQLGRLYNEVKSDSIETYNSKKSTEEQRDNAGKTLEHLGILETKKTINKNTEKLNVGEETKVTDSGVSVDVKNLRIQGDEVKFTTEKGEISVDDITLTQKDAELVAYAQSIAKTDGDDVANLFVSQYDGQTNIDEYANAFEYVSTLSKKDSFKVDDILERKGILSGEQASAIYKETRLAKIKADRENDIKIRNEAFEKAKKMVGRQGVVDDSVFAYKGKPQEGQVAWKDLSYTQRQAVTYANGVFTALGDNVVWTSGTKYSNGLYRIADNTIYIDVDASQSILDDARLNGKDTIINTISHELTHQMEVYSPETFREVSELVLDALERYAKISDKSISRLDIISKEIKRLDEAHPETKHTEKEAISELVARACEDMLAESKEGIKMFKSLSESEQKKLTDMIKDIIYKLKDWINDLLKSYRSNSQEAKALRNMQDTFDEVLKKWDKMLLDIAEQNKAIKESGKVESKNTAESDVKFSEKEIIGISGKSYGIGVYLDSNLLTGLTEAERKEMVKEFVITELAGEHFVAYDNNKDAVDIRIATKNASFRNEKGKRRNVLKELYNKYSGFTIKQEAVVLIDELIANAKFESPSQAKHKHGWLDNNGKNDWDIWTVFIQEKNKSVWEATLNIANTTNGEKILYDIGPIKMVEQASKSAKSTTNPIILNSDKDVNTKISTKDSTGRELSEGQQKYFKDSKVRDDNGNLLVMYRGDSNEFTVFDRKKTKHSNLYGRGFYFTNSKAHAEQYGEAREFYLDIKNPLSPKQNAITKKQMLNFLKAIENDGEDYDLYNYGEGATAESVLNSVWGKGDFEMLQDVNASAIGDLVAAVELFNEVNGTNYDGIILPTETVTFNSEQAKLTSNLNPTENEDIRFSMKETVEETRDLVAVHNMQVSELERTLDLGGLPMPSIAIIKAKSGHSEYGDVSLVFDKKTIDPQADRNNKVYGGDAWTPVYPKIEYKPNAKVTKKINDKYYELSRKFGYDESRPLYNYVYDMEDILNRHKGEAEMIADLYEDQNMMQLYLLDSGKSKVETIQKEIRTELSDAEVEMNEYFIRELGADVVDEIMWDGNGTPMSYRKNYLSKYENAIREAYKKLLSDEYHFTEEQVQNVMDATKNADLIKFMRDAHKYRQNGRVTTKTEADYEATKEAIKKAAGDGYYAWVDSLFKGIEEKSGIRNNTDYFTNSGNRRSWEALHWENNLENVIKVMKSQDNGVAAFFSGQAIWGVSAKDYRSIEEIKADTDRLKQLPEDEYNEIKEGFGDRLSEIARCIMDKTERNHFIAVDNAMECIVDALRHSKTKSGILNYLKQFKHLTVTETNVEDIVSLVTDISNMPTEYFEAKPKRAVELNEIATAIIPDNTSDSTKARLDNIGIKYVEYESGNEQSRLDALNSLEDFRFSDKESDEENLFTDIEGKERSILKHNELGYKVLGTRKYNSYFPSAQEAIDAENEGIKSYYAKKLSVKMSYIDKMLENDSLFLAKLSSNDVHFSDKDISVYDIMGETDRILKENEEFKAEIERLNERLKLERQVTHGNHFNQNHLGAVAGHLRNISKSNMDKFELMKALRDVYSYIAHSENVTWEEVFRKCSIIAQEMLSSAKPETVVDNYSKEILRDIRDKKISFSDVQKKEAQYIFGKNWNRNFFGRTTITDNGISLEYQWQEWAELYPHLFDRNISDADMPGELYNIIGNLQDASETILEYDEAERTRWLAREIYNQYWNVSPIRTTADKYDKQIKRLNFEHRKAMAEFRSEYKERLEGQKLADDIHYGRKMSEQRESFNSKLAERNAQIQRHKELYNKLRERKDNEIALAKQYGRERLDKYKENAERKTVIQSILATTTSLNKKLVTNSKESHIPETLKPVVINLINAIDFSSKQLLGMKGSKKDMRGTPTKRDMALDNTFSKVKSMSDEELTLKQSIQDALELFENGEKVANNTSDGTMDFSLIALDANLIDSIKTLIKAIDALEKTEGQDFVIQKMDLDSLRVLNAMVKSISNWASKADAALSSKHKERISQLGEGTIEECNPLGQRQNYIDAVESVKNFFSWSNLLPVNAFKRLGKFGEKIFSFLQGAQDTLSFHQEEIINFTNELFKNHKVKEWREEVKEFDLRLPNGRAKKVRMPVSYIMTLYCVAKQEDGMRHLTGRDKDGNQLTYESEGKTRLGGGMTIKGFKEKNSLKVSKDGENTILTEGLISKITSVLTTEQREVADKMQEFMNTKGSEWCDAVSLALYGIKKFGIKDYFPLTVSPNTIKVLNPKDKRQSIHFFSILNYGFTKNRNPKAKQSIEIGDIFETFANHMSMQAIYSAYALPIYDVVRWYNYKRTDLDGSEIGVMNSIENAFGEAATTYIGRLISDLNGQHESSRLGFITKIFKNTKLAMVGNSLSVTLLQPSAYIKAMTKISPKYLIKSALYVKDFGAGKGVKKAKQYCGIALWKSQGNFDTDISRNVSSKIMHDEKWYDKLKELSLSAAGWMDERTWGVLWNACEFDVRENQNDLKVGSQEFYETVANKLRDVIYETQVVDSPLTRSDLMRSGDTGAKMITMFASEITVAYNLVNEAFVNAHLDVKRYGKEAARKRNVKNIAMALTAYTLTSAVSQIIYTAVQAWRDDDEEKEFEDYLKMYLSNFLSDWVLIGKIPYVKDFLNSMQGYSSSRPDTLWLDSTAKAIKYWGRAFDGKEGAGDKAIKESLKALSYLSGVPGYNFYRDTMATLDKLGILDADDFKEMLDDLFD